MKKAAMLTLYLMLLNCSGQEKRVKLDNALNDYGRAIRWGLYQNATEFGRSRSAPGFPDSKDIRVTAYEPLRREQREEGDLVLQSVEIRYYDLQVGKEKRLIDEQWWRYDVSRKRWFLETDLPRFK
jgi:hypothetical protein